MGVSAVTAPKDTHDPKTDPRPGESDRMVADLKAAGSTEVCGTLWRCPVSGALFSGGTFAAWKIMQMRKEAANDTGHIS